MPKGYCTAERRAVSQSYMPASSRTSLPIVVKVCHNQRWKKPTTEGKGVNQVPQSVPKTERFCDADTRRLSAGQRLMQSPLLKWNENEMCCVQCATGEWRFFKFDKTLDRAVAAAGLVTGLFFRYMVSYSMQVSKNIIFLRKGL